jgi:hypothetical protein
MRFFGIMPINIYLKKMKQLFTYFIALPAMLSVILAWTETDESIAQLRLDYAALWAAEDDYRAQREFGGLSGTDAADYAAYVARLQRRVFEDCKAVLDSGANSPQDLPCPKFVPQGTQAADIVMEAERTPDEQVAALDEMLMAGLSEYDERLLTEQERIKAAAPNSNSGSDGGGNGAGDEGDGSGGGGDSDNGQSDGQSDGQGDGQGDGDNGADGQGRNSGGTAGDNQGGQQDGGQRQGGPVDSSQGSGDAGSDTDQPSDIPDGGDDDVVARQLREAAENESDPELKEKLWEEYRRYTRGTS